MKTRSSWPQCSRDFLMLLDSSLEALRTKRKHWRTWILFCCASMRLLMAVSFLKLMQMSLPEKLIVIVWMPELLCPSRQ
ncbi:hypothetical protein Gorai_008406 [Gossypium raimondii]|uniref:Uncharacterized protein n=1 Tax=Gossypium raimondii TaxID=29730 RepID=A0A7J8QBK8_GOSRA|nr:hypothetical protein [Gossypium raimondii]